MIKGMVEYQVNMRNKFPGENRISDTMSPSTIIAGIPWLSYNDLKLEYGQYVQTHDHPSKSNNMKTRTTLTISIRPSGSTNGWLFMSLEIGKQILRYKWTVLPIPECVIDKVQELAETYKLKKKLSIFSMLTAPMMSTRVSTTKLSKMLV